eukprot:jgi/Bigna1/83573/fgenesh1_pg.110_\
MEESRSRIGQILKDAKESRKNTIPDTATCCSIDAERRTDANQHEKRQNIFHFLFFLGRLSPDNLWLLLLWGLLSWNKKKKNMNYNNAFLNSLMMYQRFGVETEACPPEELCHNPSTRARPGSAPDGHLSKSKFKRVSGGSLGESDHASSSASSVVKKNKKRTSVSSNGAVPSRPRGMSIPTATADIHDSSLPSERMKRIAVLEARVKSKRLTNAQKYAIKKQLQVEKALKIKEDRKIAAMHPSHQKKYIRKQHSQHSKDNATSSSTTSTAKASSAKSITKSAKHKSVGSMK